MTDRCDCEACAQAAHRMQYITDLIEWSFPYLFTAHSKLIVHFNQDDPNAVEVEDGHDAQEDLLRMFRLIEGMHIYSREVRTINQRHNLATTKE
ncbi:MAG: hypothetical protein PVF49_12475 [Anaerolineales bacterium]|jgi:hypothetical protein